MELPHIGDAPDARALGEDAGADRAYRPGMASEGFHEPEGLLSESTKDMHRAITSLREELEAVDWYQQRAEATGDPELRAILIHNKHEEIEHAAMLLEWMRRKDAVLHENLTTYLETSGDITKVEAAAKGGAAGGGGDGSLGIGSLKQGGR